MFVRTSSVHYLEYKTAHVLSAQNKRTEAERETGRLINFELVILHQSTTLSKL